MTSRKSTGVPGGTLFGFAILESIGAGARTQIHRVQDPDGTVCAMKHLRLRTATDRRFLAQMRREHVVASSMTHAGIRSTHRLRLRRAPIRVAEAALLMELIAGHALSEERPATVRRTVSLFLQLADSLSALHENGWVHGDVTPSNLVVSDEKIILIDLGQAARIGETKDRIQGTPGFMAAEQLKCAALSERTDVFGFAATMHWSLTGKVLDDSTPLEHVGADLPDQLAGLLRSCLAVEPTSRPTNMAALTQTLEETQMALDVEHGPNGP